MKRNSRFHSIINDFYLPYSHTPLNNFVRRASSTTAFAFVALLAACDGKSGEGSSSSDQSDSSSSISSSSSSTGVVVPLSLVQINEAVAVNETFLDEDGDAPDWFEIRNNSSEPVSLAGWTVTDKADEPFQWTFPDIELAASEVLRIWASDKDRYTLDDPEAGAPILHTNFKLSSSGETLYLYDETGGFVHRLEIPEMPDGVAVGLAVDTNERVLYTEPTPGAENTTQEYSGYVPSKVQFSHDGGVLSPASVMLGGAGLGEEIRYTLDATIPNESSPVYREPLIIDENTVVRARIFRDGQIPSETTSRTYLADQQHDLPVVGLITDPLNFFDLEYGIYTYGAEYEDTLPFDGANFWEDWEREIHVSFYEADGNLGFAHDAGVKIFGGWSRTNAQRSLSLFARSEYGPGEFEYPLFAQRDYDEYESFVLRNSGNDWMRTMLRDVTLTSLLEDADIEVQAFRPVVTYLNGEYWGLYNLREKVNEHFLADKFDLDKDELIILRDRGYRIQGSNIDYYAMVDFLEENTLADEDNYRWIADQVDVENFALYQIAQIYFGNTDWPGGNVKFWKEPEGKWRWILYDTDYSFGSVELAQHQYDNLSYALSAAGDGRNNPPWSTLLLRRLVENDGFRSYFINRFADEINFRFNPTRVIDRIDTNMAVIESEMPRQLDRWETELGKDVEVSHWQQRVQIMRDFAQLRPDSMRQFIIDRFELSGAFDVLVSNPVPEQGHVQISTLDVTNSEWSGVYFGGVPLPVSAVPAEGFIFSHWEGVSEELSAEPSLTLNLVESMSITPVFVAE